MEYKIPLFDLNYDEREEKAVTDVIRSKWISTGPKCLELERKFSEMLNAKFAVSLSNCTSALHLAMLLLNIQEGDEVICPSLTFVATVNSVRYVKAIPVFADITSYEDLTIDIKDIERKITRKTRAIVVMHYGGFACNMDGVMEIAKRYNLKVIEDACHGPLSETKGRKLGTFGDLGCFSFFSNKNISTGEGGMLVTNTEEYYKKALLLRSHGMTSLSFERAKGHSTAYDVIDLGYNYRMDDMRAALALVQLEKIKKDLIQREEIRKFYIEKLCKCEEIIIPFKEYEEFSSNYIFPVVLRNSTSVNRDKIRYNLAEAGIQTSVHYPAVHRFLIYEDYSTELINTEYIADNEITLPFFSSLSEKDIIYVCKNLLSNFLKFK